MIKVLIRCKGLGPKRGGGGRVSFSAFQWGIEGLSLITFVTAQLTLKYELGVTRHGKSGDLGNPESWKILQIAEDLNRNIK